MSAKTVSPNSLPKALRWRLWIDGCGGFLLLVGDRVSFGRASNAPAVKTTASPWRTADVGVHADWPREAGVLQRHSGDYFWTSGSGEGSKMLVSNGQSLDTTGSAKVTLHRPSPLSNTVVLNVAPPHRFDEHVDSVVLVDQTVLIGASRDCHLRHRDASERVVLVHRSTKWSAKVGVDGEFEELITGRPTTLGSTTMTLELA